MTLLRNAITALLMCFVQYANVMAQDTPTIAQDNIRPVIQGDGTYVFYSPLKNTVFEAQLAPRIILRDQIAEKTISLLSDPELPKRKTVYGWQLSGTPMVRLRMSTGSSFPVRTPSYMPKGTLQWAAITNTATGSKGFGPVRMILLECIPWGHHSNGQDGDLFIPGTTEINLKDGSFGTNYFQVGASYSRMRISADGVASGGYASDCEWTVKVSAQFHHGWLFPGGLDEQQAKIYGRTRVMAEARAAWRFSDPEAESKSSRLEVSGKLEGIFGSLIEGVPRMIATAQLLCLPEFMNGSGVFFRLYWGQDYYNLRFTESVRRVEIGLTMHQDTFLSFSPR